MDLSYGGGGHVVVVDWWTATIVGDGVIKPNQGCVYLLPLGVVCDINSCIRPAFLPCVASTPWPCMALQ